MGKRVGSAVAAVISSVIYMTSVSTAGAQSESPSYADFRAGKFLRYLNAGEGDLNAPPRIGLRIGGETYHAVLDSGSTGIVIAAALIPNFEQLPSNGDARLTYTSSGRVMLGRWVVTPVDLVGERGAFVSTDPMPVLAVTEVRCLENARDCTPHDAPRDIAMVGIGFGREGDRESHSTPDKNPLLRIAWPGDLSRHGYILTKTGVHVGLTRANTKRFDYIKLEPKAGVADWSGIPACIAINGTKPPACGSMLVDTGVSAMFMTVPDAQAGGAQGTLPDGTQISILAGSADQSRELYSFTIGEALPLAPRGMHLRVSQGPSFVNTSLHFLNGFDVLYDADGGYAGFRRRLSEGGIDEQY
jgi:hypothetical protein